MTTPATDTITLSEVAFLIFSYGLVTAISLSLVIIIHEFGHYLMARFFGVRVTKFSLGFGKEMWGRTDRAGTRWAISLLPVGGYVEIFGDVDPNKPVIWDRQKNCERSLTEEELRVSFCTKKVWQRMLIVAAGPGINILLALTLLAGLFMIRGVPVVPPLINSIAVGTAGFDAGFQLGDRILEMDGKKISDFEQVYKVTSADWVNPHHFKVLRNGAEIMITMKAREIDFTDWKGRKWDNRGRIGIMNGTNAFFENIVAVDGVETSGQPDKARDILKQKLGKVVKVEYNLKENREDQDVFLTVFPSEANQHLNDSKDYRYDRIFTKDVTKIDYIRDDPLSAYGRAGNDLLRGIGGFFKLLGVVYKGKTEQRPIGGIKVVGSYVGKSVNQGLSAYILVLVMLSTGIAFINILPIPLLDGGFLIFLLYEAFTGRSVSPRVQNLSFAIALVFLGGIMILANLIDLVDFLNP